jgi:uncharacterized membrane protein
MDEMTLARAIHVASVVHWIGGVWFVTFVILPAVRRFAEPARRVAFFEEVEGRFAFQARISTLAAGLSGFWLTWRMEAFDRFLDPGRFWFMHAMVALWAIFTLVLFVLEPLVLHRWFATRAARDPEGTMAIVLRLHRVLSTAAVVTVIGAVLGAHGGL